MAYTNSNVAHAWAHGLDQDHYGSNLRHNNGILTSYSTCIGQRLELNGNIVFVINTHRYSTSTSKHQHAMRYAIPSMDNNVHIFAFDKESWGADSVVSKHQNTQHKQLVLFGLDYLAKEYEACKAVMNAKTKHITFSRKGYDKMCRWFDVTGCMTISKLLRMRLDEFAKYMPRVAGYNFYYDRFYNLNAKNFRKFLKMMADGKSVEFVIDAVNGKGTYQEYMKRTQHLRQADNNRAIADYIGYASNRRITSKVLGKYPASRVGTINAASRKKHANNWLEWLLEEKHKNEISALQSYWRLLKTNRRAKSITKLERHCGMCMGFGPTRLTQFNYNGVLVTFSDFNHFASSRHISCEEYEEYTKLNHEEQKTWVLAKRQWMLEQLLKSEQEYNAWRARMEEERRTRELEAARQIRMEKEREAYKTTLMQQGDDGIRQLWHEGFDVSIHNRSNSFYHGGNVLLRVVNNNVVTSKNIVILFEECQRLWRLVQHWHTNNTQFIAGETVRSTNASWSVTRYQNDILIAGCHAIAYKEMQYAAKELGLI